MLCIGKTKLSSTIVWQMGKECRNEEARRDREVEERDEENVSVCSKGKKEEM
jgi:hypothetical protein